ncbi:MAG: dihydropyrimidinase [Chloroflexaceae bacterium]|nr:dihydropyrimidinase [Chloroflexaceae bacterium]NJL35048.1 dihydropyrimidinase [Chloroflexaceae bacterium]NJO06758.1 dihydropyrimidinase [Chloroflexaceae bacterium]
MRTVIKGGTVVTASDTYTADVLIDDEQIAAIGQNLAGDMTIDANGMYVIPGGIDVHTHLDMPFGGTTSSDNFFTGHQAAAFGGTTTHIDFAIQGKGMSLKETLDAWHGRARGKAVIDYGFHIAITDLNEAVMEELPYCIDYGTTSVKLFMAYKGALMVDDETLFRAMQQAAKHGFLICVHAENGDAIDVLIRQALEAGHTEPKYHALTRPPELEAEATYRAIRLSEVAGSPLYVVHLTNAGALEAVQLARGRGAPIYAETCVQYFFFTKDDLDRPGFEGAKWVCSPPYREVSDQQALWKGVADNSLQVISTDHCPFWYEGGIDGRPAGKELGKGNFAKIPNGCPGIEDRMKVLYTAGVRGGKFSINRWVELCCTNPARLFGMYPKKGVIAPGSDADIVIWNPEATATISAATQHMTTDYNLYEGMEVVGLPQMVFSRGRLLVDGDTWKGEAGSGVFVHRKPFKV